MACLVLGCAFSAAHAYSQSRTSSLKAAYIYYFTKFVYWPGEQKVRAICVLGSADEVREELEKVAKKSAGNISLRFSTDEPFTAKGCDIVFITDSNAALQGLAEGTLLVADERIDHPEAAINLVVENNKLAFDIYRAKAKDRGIEISAKLLGLAREVRE
ncbi:YfiR family protein [Simiduia sp. 21SJ11W-1]|uniref:YfiR family protein n=1 Tax=Simiduia sp. 21SJ11W-1 TaxID=2909669 RepID=UPI0020A05206|nr:YfiR family protein [Simiduia sp. 21SJ11W-1]UTA47901.1 YfiR family protein [Simiduia sp. 21SJ11W-1]